MGALPQQEGTEASEGRYLSFEVGSVPVSFRSSFMTRKASATTESEAVKRIPDDDWLLATVKVDAEEDLTPCPLSKVAVTV